MEKEKPKPKKANLPVKPQPKLSNKDKQTSNKVAKDAHLPKVSEESKITQITKDL